MTLHFHAREESFDAMGKQINRVIDAISQRNYYRFSSRSTWQPAINLYEDEAAFYLCVDLAGMKQNDVSVEVADQRISIRGNRPVPPPPGTSPPGCVLRIEIDSGPFERTIDLPSSADMNSTEATLQDGFLWLSITKQ